MDFLDCKSIGDIRLKQELLQMTSVIADSDYIYHYTSIKGLKGIVQADGIKLRFTKFDSLNDTTEGMYILECYKIICESLLKSKAIDLDFYNSIITIKLFDELPFFHIIYIDGKALLTASIFKYVTYLFCLSKEQDALPLWNYYLKNTTYYGCNLGFDVLKLKDKFLYHPFHRSYSSEILCVEYDFEEKCDILADFIQALFSYRDQDDAMVKIKEAISSELHKWQYAFKNNCFSHEQEVRIAIHIPLNEAMTVINEFVDEDVKYEKDNGIPKHIYILISDKTILNNINLPPNTDERSIHKSIKSCTDSGYKIFIEKSIILVRF